MADFESFEPALRAAQQKLRALRGLDERTFRQKMGSYLARRGFGYDTIREVCDHLLEMIDNEIEE